MQQQPPYKVHPLMSSTCDWVFEALMMSDETIRLAPEISSLKEKCVYEDAEITAAVQRETGDVRVVITVYGEDRPLITF